MLNSLLNWKQWLRAKTGSELPAHQGIVTNSSGMTILEVLIAGSMMIMIFLALGEMTVNTLKVARNVESQSDESDLRMQIQVSLRDFTNCSESVVFEDGKSLKDKGLTQMQLEADSDRKLKLASVQLIQRDDPLKSGVSYGPRIKIAGLDLAWDESSSGKVITYGTQISARLETTSDRGDVIGGRQKKVLVPLTLVRASADPTSPITGCYYGDADSSGKSPYLIVSQRAEDAPDCEGSDQEAIQECINKLDPDRGGTVFLKAGIYTLDPFRAGSLFSLKIAGKNVRILGDPGTELKVKTKVGILADQHEGFTLEKIQVNLNDAKPGACGVVLRSENHLIRNVRFLSSVTEERCAVTVMGNSISILENEFSGFSRSANGVITNTPLLGGGPASIQGLTIRSNVFNSGVARPEGKVIELQTQSGDTSLSEIQISQNTVKSYFFGFRVYGGAGTIKDVQISGNRVETSIDGIAVRCLETPVIPPTNIDGAAPACAEIDRVQIQGNIISGKVERSGDLLTDILTAMATVVSSAVSVEGRGKSTLVSGNVITCTGGGGLQGIAVEKSSSLLRTDPQVQIVGNKIFDCTTGINAAGSPSFLSTNVLERTGEIIRLSNGIIVNEGSSVVDNRVVRFERGIVVRKTQARFAYDGTQISRNLILGNAGLFESGNQSAGDTLASSAVLVQGVGDGRNWQVQFGSLLVGNTWLFLRDNIVDGFREAVRVENFSIRSLSAVEAVKWIDLTGTRWVTQPIGQKPILVRDNVTVNLGSLRSIAFTELGGGAWVEIYDLKNTPVASDQPTGDYDWSRLRVNRLSLGRTPANGTASSSEGNVYYDCVWRSGTANEPSNGLPATVSCESGELILGGGGGCFPAAPVLVTNAKNPLNDLSWFVGCQNSDGSLAQAQVFYSIHCCKK